MNLTVEVHDSTLSLPEPLEPVLLEGQQEVPDEESGYVMAFEMNTETWGEAYYNHTKKKWIFCDDWHSARNVPYWAEIPSPLITPSK